MIVSKEIANKHSTYGKIDEKQVCLCAVVQNIHWFILRWDIIKRVIVGIH